MKNRIANRGIIYAHMNAVDHYVISYGIEFHEFCQAFSDLSNLLLLRHKFEDGNFNLHTLLDYVESESIQRIIEDDVYSYGDFCWLDFDDEEALNRLDGQEIAELLYLSHIKTHLRLPFYRKLNNRFAYLSHDDGWFNKIYYRTFDDFYTALGVSISSKLNEKGEKTFFGLKKKKEIPFIPIEILYPFIEEMKEGMIISIERAVHTRTTVEIPIWVIGDYYDMDEMLDEYEFLNSRPLDGKIVFDRKAKEWKAFVK
ncbi:oxalate:formate antiporter [Heyndrickxia sporothermodurans]|nr:oxalate:formate antiporter [Heyndrickxia sporothermodurans]